MEAGQVESEGEFLIDVDKALEKLAAYQLPFEYAWVLKIVQAAVASGAERLRINQTSTGTVFAFPVRWTAGEIEEAFHKPPGSDKALGHLMTGLWSASLNDGRPFLIHPMRGEALMWTGRSMRREERSSRIVGVEVSHRTLSQGKGFPVLNWIERARVNASISQVLSQRACHSPIPVLIDGRALEPKYYPSHDWNNHHYLRFGWTGGDSQKLSEAVAKFVKDKGLQEQVLPGRVDSSWYLTARLGKRKTVESVVSENNWALRPTAQKSRILWLTDGVVVRDDPVSEIDSWVSLMIVASGDGLKTDLTGFDFLDDEEIEYRTQAACQGVSETLGEFEDPDFSQVIGEVMPGSNIFGGVASFIGGSVGGTVVGLLISPPLAILGTLAGGAGGLGTFALKNEEIQAYPVKVLARRRYAAFQARWLELYPPSS